MNSKITNQQKIIALSICALISYNPILTFVNSVVNLFVSESFIYDTIVIYILFLLIIMKSMSYSIKSPKKDIFIFLFIFIFIYLISYFFFPQNRVFMFTSFGDIFGNPFYILFIYSFPGYIFARSIKDYGIFYDYLRRSSLLVVVFTIITFFIEVNKGGMPQYMVFSYNMALQSLVLIIMFFENKRILDLIIGVSGCFIILIAGARGPFLSIIIAFVLYIFFRKVKLLSKVVSLTLITFTTFLIYFFFNEIALSLFYSSQRFGINSRTLQLILNNTVFYDSGRGIIIDNIRSSLSIVGLGLFGDRVASGGTYAHNFFVEIIAQFGYILGPIIIGLVIYAITNGILCKKYRLRNLIIIFLSTGFFKLFLSGSYLNQEPSFFILLGLSVNSIFLRRGNSNESIVVMQHNVTDNCRAPIKTSE